MILVYHATRENAIGKIYKNAGFATPNLCAKCRLTKCARVCYTENSAPHDLCTARRHLCKLHKNERGQLLIPSLACIAVPPQWELGYGGCGECPTFKR